LSDLLKFIEEEDALALRFGDGLHDPPYCASGFLEFLHEERIVTWQIVSSWVEVIATINETSE
jgi:hypothetical protein